MKKAEIITILDTLKAQYPEDSLRTIWEIFCWQNFVDENAEGKESKVFDAWVKKFKK